MKKYAWIVALLAALSLAIFGIGCGGGGGNDDTGGSDEDNYNITDLTVSPTTGKEDGIDDMKAADTALGKGWIIGEDFAKVKAAPAGSFIRLTVSGTVNLNWDSIGAVGIGDMAGQSDNRLDFKPKAGGTYSVDTPTANIFALDGGDTAYAINLNIWGDHKIDKARLFEPKTEVFVEVKDITGIKAVVNNPVYKLVGKVQPADAKNQTIVWTLKSGDAATLTTDTLTFTKEGGVKVTATIANAKEDGTAFAKDFDVEYIDLPLFGDATYVPLDGKELRFGADGSGDFELFASAKFLVVGFKGGPSKKGGDGEDKDDVNLDGFGGTQFAIQHDGDEWDWHQADLGADWTDNAGIFLSPARTANEVIYFVLPMNELPDYAAALEASQVKVILNDGLDFSIGAWVTKSTLTKGTGLAHGKGWFARDPGLAPPED